MPKPMIQSRQATVESILNRRWVSEVAWLESIDSTSDELRRRLDGSTTPSTDKRLLVVADQQTAGRGRGGNQWWSPDGCLMLSLALSVNDSPSQAERIPLLALHIGLAVAETIEAWQEDAREGLQLSLKWPNDVYLSRKKAAGILIESVNCTDGLRWIVGIGLNVQMDWGSAPSEIAERATCISRQAGVAVEPETVLVHLVESIERQVEHWTTDADESWRMEWQRRCLLHGRQITLRTAGKRLSGLCNGVDANGRLLLQTAEGEQVIQSAEDITWQ